MDLQDSDSSQEGQSWVTIAYLVCYAVSRSSLKVKAMDGFGSGWKMRPSTCRNQAGHGRHPRVEETMCSLSIADVQALGTSICGFESSLSPLLLSDLG